MSNPISLTGKTLLIVSGASRGIGRTIAIECAAKFATGSLVILLARSQAGLEETRADILERNDRITVVVHPIDLTRPTPEELNNIFETGLQGRSPSEFELCMIVHNVGTIGDITLYAQALSNNPTIWEDYYMMNLFSVAALNATFMKAVSAQNAENRIFIVNLTSGASVNPYKSLTLYW